MVMVRTATANDWQVLREIRLEALRDAPSAFGSTYAEQAVFAEADWRSRISRGKTFFAYISEVNGVKPDGLVGGLQEEAATVELVSLWVRPHARGMGVGEVLVETVIRWARATNASSVHLWFTETNQRARRLYERCGFSPTGERQELSSNRDLIEVGMTCLL